MFKAVRDLSRGVLRSRTSPVHERKTEGITRTFVFPASRRNTGDVGSPHAVYPLASKVDLIPTDGKEEASGSDWTSWEAENLSIISPSALCNL
nr:hypothetical protein [Candidatus Endomicrobium trichonymphae]